MSTCVVVATDRDYVIPTEVMLRSLDANYHGSEKLDVYVLVPERMRNWEFSGTKFKNLNLVIHVPVEATTDEFAEVTRPIYENQRITSTSMYRFFIADSLRSYKKAIYIDSDCVIARDIAPLLDYKPTAPVAAFPEIQIELADNPSFKDASYFNSGVMVLDLTVWRAQQYGKKLMRLASTFTNWTGSTDQDLLNAIFRHNWTPLPMSFNYLINIYPDIEMKDPLIVHWAGKRKPWLSNCPDTTWKQMWKMYKNQ